MLTTATSVGATSMGAAACLLLAMLAARGTSELRNIYVIERGYEDLAERLNTIGAKVEYFQD